MRARTFGYFFRESLRNLSRNGLMALAAATTIVVSLLIMGVFMIVIDNLNYLSEQAKKQVQLRVFLMPDTTLDQAMALRDEIKTFSALGVRQVTFVSKQKAAEEVERIWKVPDLFAENDENPLPDMLQVELKRGAQIQPLADKIKILPGVAEVLYQDFIRSMLIVVQIVWVVGITLILVVSFGVLYIIVNTVRLTVFARRKEIEIMKLVGATDWFIRWPFILEGLILGLCGACLAAIVLSKGYYFLYKSVHQTIIIPLAPESLINNQLLLYLLPAGILFGVLGSLMSVKKFLRE